MDWLGDDPLVKATTEYVQSYMSQYDASHSFDHIQRVVRLARQIYTATTAAASKTTGSESGTSSLDARVVLLSALLHDVGDHKYPNPDHPDPTTAARDVLLRLGADAALAEAVQAVCSGVSYSAEVKRGADATAALVARHPELAVVQDADRLDALGAVGLGRLFTYGGARTSRSMAGSMAHVDEKLLRLERMMKTEEGRRLARERTERIRLFRAWWVEETGEEPAP